MSLHGSSLSPEGLGPGLSAPIQLKVPAKADPQTSSHSESIVIVTTASSCHLPGPVLEALRQGTDHHSNLKDADQGPGVDVHQHGGQKHIPELWGQCAEGTNLALGEKTGVAGKHRDD